MRLLVLGGTHFVGRAIVEAAAAAGVDVTMLNRGHTTVPGLQVRTLVADRTDRDALGAALGDETWDVVVDTWSDAPRVVADACELLAGRAARFIYISTVSVYAAPIPMNADEQARVVEADPDRPAGLSADDFSSYPVVKRGAELAVLRAFGKDRTLLARPGLILGPYENICRLPWWLRRIERGGQVLAPGNPATPVQYIDVRDLAHWVISAAQRDLAGVFNVVSRQGHTTMGELLDTIVEVVGGDAELVWVPPDAVLAAGIEPWSELPIWVPEGHPDEAEGNVDVSAAFAAGLTARPIRETVTDTWAWLQAEGDPPPRPGIGLDAAKERAVLDA